MARATLVAAITAGLIGTTIVLAQPANDTGRRPAAHQPEKTRQGQPGQPGGQPAGQPAGQMPADFQLPPGMTPEMMQACMEAATPGEEHQVLTRQAGDWDMKNTMWMSPESQPMTSTGSAKITPFLDGRFVKVETKGEMPGMGPYQGFALNGYDNVGKRYQSTWVDNFGTGMAVGTGELSSDKKTLTWNYNFNCPMTQGPKTFRIVENYQSPDRIIIEMHGEDLQGKEYKMMEAVYTRSKGRPSAPSASAPTDDR